MHTLNHIIIDAPASAVYQVASETGEWPRVLAHYRYVHILHHRDDVRVVEMSADRDFGFVRYATWWSSIQWDDPANQRISFRHVGGITRGMDVEWRIVQRADGCSEVTIVHDLRKSQPLVALFYNLVVGYIFVHFIAQRTLEGVKQYVEQRTLPATPRG